MWVPVPPCWRVFLRAAVAPLCRCAPGGPAFAGPSLRGSVSSFVGCPARAVFAWACRVRWSGMLPRCCLADAEMLSASPGRAHRAGLGSCPLPAPKKIAKKSTFFVERIDIFRIFVLGIKGLHYPLHILTHRRQHHLAVVLLSTWEAHPFNFRSLTSSPTEGRRNLTRN